MIIDGSTLADTAPLGSSDLIYVGVDKGKAVWKGDKRAWHPWMDDRHTFLFSAGMDSPHENPVGAVWMASVGSA